MCTLYLIYRLSLTQMAILHIAWSCGQSCRQIANHLCVFCRSNKAKLLSSPASKNNGPARPPGSYNREPQRSAFIENSIQTVIHSSSSSPCLTILPSTLVISSMTDVPLLGSIAPWTQLSLWLPYITYLSVDINTPLTQNTSQHQNSWS